VEVVVALSIIFLILSAIYWGFSVGIKANERAGSHIKLLLEAYRLSGNIESELLNSCKYSADYDNFVGTSAGISFISRIPIETSKGISMALARISYISSKGKGVVKLIDRSDMSLPSLENIDIKKAARIGKYLSRISFVYGYDSGSELHPIDWEDEWKDNSALPKLIKISFIFKDRKTVFSFDKIICIEQGALGSEEFSLE